MGAAFVKTWPVLALAAALLIVYAHAQAMTKPEYDSPFVAMLVLPEAKIISDTYLKTFRGNTEAFKPIMDVGMDPKANTTYFLPDSAAWGALSKQLCLTLPGLQDIIAKSPKYAVDYLKLNIVPGKAIFSNDFKDGEQLQTMMKPFTLNLTRRQSPTGEDEWVFPGLALDKSDVKVIETNITAGASVIHFLDAAIFDDDQRTFWMGIRNLTCPPPVLSAGAIAGIVISCVTAGALVVAILVRMRRKQQAQQRRSAALPSSSKDVMYLQPPAAGAANDADTSHTRQPQPPDAASHSQGSKDQGADQNMLVVNVGRHKHNGPAGSGSSSPGFSGLGDASSQQSGQLSGPLLGTAPQPPLTGLYSQSAASVASRSLGSATTAWSEGSGTSSSAPVSTFTSHFGHLEGGNHSVELLRADEQQMPPVFEPNPSVTQSQLAAWLALMGSRGGGHDNGGGGPGSGDVVGDAGSSSSSGSSSRGAASLVQQLRKDLAPQTGNPHIIHNYTNFTREVEHNRTAVYFADSMHNNKQFALKFYASPGDFAAERDAYRLLAVRGPGGESKYIPSVEMAYPAMDAHTSVLVFERGQCTLDTFTRRERPSLYQQMDIFHQLLSAVQHLHDHGVVHRDMKPANVVLFPKETFTWKLIDLGTIARAGEDADIVYTREYASPEVAVARVRGQCRMRPQPATDMWGVGVIMYELATGERFFPPEWSSDGGRRIWQALCGFTALPSEQQDLTAIRGVDKGVMKLVRRLLHREPAARPTPRQLLSERLFSARGNTTTKVSQSSSISRGSSGESGPFGS